jgi:hypothetical protein
MKVILIMLMSVIVSFSYGQTAGMKAASNEQAPVALVFNQQEFGERFSVLAYTDENYDYYAIDLTKLGGKFERVYFMNLTYEDSRLVNIDADLSRDQTWFKTYYTNKEDVITCLLKDLKEKTEKASLSMTTDEKNAWMNKYNKFEKNSKNE